MPEEAAGSAREAAPADRARTTRRAHAGQVITAVDEALAALLRRDVLNDAQVEVVFDAPTKEWAAGRSAPVVDAFLYDIREDSHRRQHGEVAQRDARGRLVARRPPPRVFKLSYLLTAWTQRPEDEHRLLTAALACLLRYDALPPDLLPEELTTLAVPLGLTVAMPPPQDRSFADVWSAMGGQLKPSLDVVVSAPLTPGMDVPLAPPVQEPAKISLLEKDRSR